MSRTLRIVAVSDTHGMHDKMVVPPGDILLHAGDISIDGGVEDMEEFDAFLATLPHRHKIVVCGNHDFCFERTPERARAALRHATYLEDEAVVVEGLKIYGSPWQPWFFDWAFNLPRGAALREKWAAIPDDTDVLVTHSPPFGHGDRTHRGENAGCEDLLRRVAVVRPRLHVFGHIHEGWGTTVDLHTTFVNACICTLEYRPTNPPIVFDYVVEGPEAGAE